MSCSRDASPNAKPASHSQSLSERPHAKRSRICLLAALVVVMVTSAKVLQGNEQILKAAASLYWLTHPWREFDKTHVVLLSSTYYKKPIANYTANSMAVLFNTAATIERPFDLICWSRNDTHHLSHLAHLVRIAPQLLVCRWTQYIAVCQVAENLSTFAISEISSTRHSSPVQIPYREAVSERHGVVACFSPLFYYERWQTLILALEVYRQFGTDLQVYYIQSILSQVMDVLRIFERQKAIVIETWASLDIDDLQLGYDPNMELDMRNQAAAHTDCLLKYKASAEFIVVADIDDILFPRFGRTYREEFRSLLTVIPDAAGFMYERYNANFTTSWSPEEFSLTKLMKSISITRNNLLGKSVVIPSRVQTARPHSPGQLHEGYHMTRLMPHLNAYLHIRKWRTVDRGYGFRRGRIPQHEFYGITNLLPEEDMVKFGTTFYNLVEASNGSSAFFSLPNSTIYFEPMYKCYARLVFSKFLLTTCAGPALCLIPPVKGLRCDVAMWNFKHDVIGENVFIHHMQSPGTFATSTNGCTM